MNKKKQAGIKITYLTGATKTVYWDDIDSGRSEDPREWPSVKNKQIVASVEEGDF